VTLRDLSEGLRDLAEDVQSVDLHARAVRTSRRLRARRAAGVVSGALAVLLVVMVGLSLSWQRTDPGSGMDAADGVGVEESASDAVSDSASAYSQGDDSAVPMVAARVGYYLRETDPGVYAVLSWAQGDDPRLEISGDVEFASSVAISPNGRYAAYYNTGELAVADIGIDASDHAEVVYSVEANGDPCAPPSWASDSSAVVLSEAGAENSTLVDLSDDLAVPSAYPRPAGCSSQLFTYGTDVSAYGFASVVDEKVTWADADTGTELTSATYDTAGLGFTVSRLASLSSTGEIACLAGEPEEIPSRAVCSALATPKGLVGPGLPVDGTLMGASFLDNGFLPADFGGSDGMSTVEVASQDVVLRVRSPDDGTYIAQTSVTTETVQSGDWGDVTVTALDPVSQPFAEPPSLADAYLLAYTP